MIMSFVRCSIPLVCVVAFDPAETEFGRVVPGGGQGGAVSWSGGEGWTQGNTDVKCLAEVWWNGQSLWRMQVASVFLHP